MGQIHLGGGREIAVNDEHAFGVGLGDQLISGGHACARADPFAAGGGEGGIGGGEGFFRERQIFAARFRARGGCDGHRRQIPPAFQRGCLLFGELQHGVGENGVQVATFHMAVMVRLAAGQVVDKEQAFHHRGQVAVAHQAAGQPNGSIHGHAIGGGERGKFRVNAQLLPDGIQRLVLFAHRINHGRDAFFGELPGLAQGVPEGAHVVEGGRFENLHAHGFDYGARVAAGEFIRGAGQLDAVAVHDERDGGLVDAGHMEAIEGVAGNPAGIAAVAEDPGVGAISGALAEGLADGGGNHHAESAAVELRAAGHPGHMAGDVQPAPERVDYGLAIQIAQHGQRGKIADGSVRVFDGKVPLGLIDQRQREQERRNHIQAAAHVVHFVDFRQRGDRFDGQAGGVNLQGFEQDDVVAGEAGELFDIQSQRGNGGNDFAAHILRVGQQVLVALLLKCVGRE